MFFITCNDLAEPHPKTETVKNTLHYVETHFNSMQDLLDM